MPPIIYFKNFCRKLAYTGITPDLNFHNKRRIFLLNTMCLVGIVAYVLILIGNVLKHTHLVFLSANLSAQVILFATLYFNYKRKYRTAALFCSATFLAYINIVAVLYGRQSGLEYINILLCVSPLVFFDGKKTIIIFSFLSVVCFFGCKYLYTFLPPVLEHGNLPLLNLVITAVLFTCIFLMFLFFKDDMMRYSAIVEKQHRELAEKNADINDSIQYARNIQYALLKFDDKIAAALPQSFILYKPRDIVSGDFYWFAEKNGKVYGACGDCTGHGVPGAFMCMIGMTLLNNIVNEKEEINAGEILNLLRKGVIRMMKQTGSIGENKDGMDISLVVFDWQSSMLEFSGANHSFFLVRKGELMEFNGDRQPIGIFGGEQKPFSSQSIKMETGDTVYFSTDGYTDQFGGPKGKKYKINQFKKMLLTVNHLPMDEQKEKIMQTFFQWKGKLEQVDDVMVIGVRM